MKPYATITEPQLMANLISSILPSMIPLLEFKKVLQSKSKPSNHFILKYFTLYF